MGLEFRLVQYLHALCTAVPAVFHTELMNARVVKNSKRHRNQECRGQEQRGEHIAVGSLGYDNIDVPYGSSSWLRRVKFYMLGTHTADSSRKGHYAGGDTFNFIILYY